MKNLICLLLFCLLPFVHEAQDVLEKSLFDLPDISFKKIENKEGFEAVYELRIKQPVDHKDLSKGYFYQRAFLSHRSFSKPMVMISEGYNRSKNIIYELTELVEGNQLDIEHRFFGESIPDSVDYKYLNLEQACADLHHINQLFKKIYKSKWLCTGISKGGATTIFYRYFYPEDVYVSVPYVAPINQGYEDERIYHFLDTVGTDACRNNITSFQRRLLEKRSELMPLLKWYCKGKKTDFTYLKFEEAFEYTVLEYSFSFWQYGHDCAAIPDQDASIDEMLEHFIGVSDMSFLGDKDIAFFGPHYYQSASQMGYYGFETEDFKDLLKALPLKPNPHATFVPNKMEIKYDGSLLNNINKWLPQHGHRFIYINGDLDTWSATAVRPSEKVDALWFFMPGKHHRNARIKNMTSQEKDQFLNKLNTWLEE